MNLTLQRTSRPGQTHTFGVMNAEVCFTLEDQIREIPGKPVDEWKVPGQTAIPAGRYRVTLENSPRFGAETITLHKVPGFDYIRIHGGNDVDDTEGCPLTGLELTDTGIRGGTSQPALRMLKALVKAAIQERQEVWIDVKNPEDAP